MRSGTWIPCAAVLVVLWGTSSCSANLMDSAKFDLRAPTVSGNTISFDVYVTYTLGTGQPSAKAYLLQLDVTASSSALEPIVPPSTKPDYSAFSFQTDTNVLKMWSPFSMTAPGEFEADDNFNPANDLSPSTTPYHLGTLSYNLSKFNITPSPSLVLSLMAPGTPAGFHTFLEDTTNSTPQATTSFITGSQPFALGGSGGGGSGGGSGGDSKSRNRRRSSC